MNTIPENLIFSTAMIASPNMDFRKKVHDLLGPAHCAIQEAQGGAEALAKLEAGNYEALLLDRWLPDLDVSEFVHTVRKLYPALKVLVMDSETEADAAMEDISWQAPLREAVQASEDSPDASPSVPACGIQSEFEPDVPLPDHRAEVKAEQIAPLPPITPLPGMIGVSQAMQNVYRLSRLVSSRATTVLLMGETGTGKELVAKAIHTLSTRQKQPFITVNCAAIPEALLEAELFGYARGSFTGAFQSRMGRIHAAHGGTLFLDEVGDLPLNMQAKLLRFLQEGEVQRLGGSDVIRVDVRVIAATNAELAKRVSEKSFREDIYYRISVFPIDLIPLRERLDDILPLAVHFIDVLCKENRLPAKAISRAAGKLLEKHSWPGNVRELRNVIERAFILSEVSKEISPEHINLQSAWR